MLEVVSLSKSYGARRALADVSLSIAPGEIVGLLGANGAGKSTFISLVAGLLQPDTGSIHIDGVDAVREHRRLGSRLGVAAQETAVYPLLSVRENLAFFGKLSGLRGVILERRIGEVAEVFALTDLLLRSVGTLSGGESRRVHTAMALVGRPSLVLLDEPTAGVDVATRRSLLDVVRRLASEGAAVCYATHYLQEVETLRGTVCILDHGRIVSRAPLDELLRAHGESVAVIAFREEPQDLDVSRLSSRAERVGKAVRVPTSDPKAVIRDVLNLDPRLTANVELIEILRPSLETVFLSLTGRRYSPDAFADAAGEELER